MCAYVKKEESEEPAPRMGGEDRRYVPVRNPTQGVDEEQHAHFMALLGMAFTDGWTSNDDAAAANLQHRQGVASDMGHKGDCDRRGACVGVHWAAVTSPWRIQPLLAGPFGDHPELGCGGALCPSGPGRLGA